MAKLLPCIITGLLAALPLAQAQVFQFPTANKTLLEAGGGERFFVPTVGKTWPSGTFGCVRTEGQQLHEGIDIKCLQRDARNEPIDPVLASADGVVAYINHKQGLSNFGKYVILRHQIEGMEIYTTYAHLRAVEGDLKPGRAVRAGEKIATMGRTANTRQGISKERAHLHFEINCFLNERFPAWYQKNYPKQRNDHGQWNGQNLFGLDPRLILLSQAEKGAKFSLLEFMQGQTELCRVFVRDTNFPWLKRHPGLIVRNPATEKEGVEGYEIFLNYNGIPFKLIPRTSREAPGNDRFRLLSVNQVEAEANPCRHLVAKRGGHWELSPAGTRLLELLTF